MFARRRPAAPSELPNSCSVTPWSTHQLLEAATASGAFRATCARHSMEPLAPSPFSSAGHQFEFECLLGRDRVGGDRHLHRLAVADPLGNRSRPPAAANSPTLPRGYRVSPHLAANEQIHVSTSSSPPASANPSIAPISGLRAPLRMNVQHRPDVLAACERLQVHAGRRTRARRQSARPPSGRRRLSSSSIAATRPVERAVDRVHRFGPVERDQQHPALALGEHRPSSSLISAASGCRRRPAPPRRSCTGW